VIKGLRKPLLLVVVLAMAALACQLGGLGLSGAARETEVAWEATKEVMATRAGATARVVTTVVALQGTATALAWEGFIAEKQAWPLVLLDTFEDNENDWPVGNESGDYVDISWNIEEGKYRWTALTKDDYIYWTRPLVPLVSDFWLTVETRQLTGPADASIGVIFRMQDTQNYYALLIDNGRLLAVLLSTSEGWTRVIDWTEIPSILPFEVNRISLAAEGPRFTIFINGVLAAQAFDETLEIGRAGVTTSMYNVGDEGSFEFDNFELRAPPGSVVEEE
jgi:hypothetical protein